MKFSYNWLQSFFKEKLPVPKKLGEIISLHSFEVEEITKSGKDFILDVDILPNRAHDCLSYIGLVREIGAILNLKPIFPKVKIKEEKGESIRDYLQVDVQDKEGCLRYGAKMIKGIKVSSSPKWIQERLISSGLKPINNIVDITNYVMLETGQPLHAFDFDKIDNKKEGGKKKIIVRKAKELEKIITLDNKTFYLDNDILVIADEEEPLAIAGIKGGKKAEISEDTKTIILEAANFEMKTIRQSRQKLRIITDASLRFEHEPDKNLVLPSLERAVQLIQEIAGGKILEGMIDYYPLKAKPKKIKLEKSLVSKVLGVKIKNQEIKNYLKRLSLKIIKEEKDYLLVEVPTFRQDLNLPIDLVEEIGRLHNFDKIPSILPKVRIEPAKRDYNVFWKNEIKNFLKELGFSEVYNYSFIGEEDLRIYGYQKEQLLEVDNPLSKEFKYLKPSLLPNLLKNVKNNFKFFDKFRLFEIGKIFFLSGKQEIKEKRRLGGVIASKNRERESFYQAKGYLETLFNNLCLSDIHYCDFSGINNLAINQFKSAEIEINSKKIGFLGEISEHLLRKLEIKGEVIFFEIDFEELVQLASEEQEYLPISPYPAAVRDIALLVPLEVKVVDVLNEINLVGGELIRDVDLFDIYEGENLPAGKKSLAFHIVYQAENRTLSSEEINNLQNKIIKKLESHSGWQVRKG